MSNQPEGVSAMNQTASCRWQGSFCIEVTPLPCLLTVFGALGDLAGRKLFPALFKNEIL